MFETCSEDVRPSDVFVPSLQEECIRIGRQWCPFREEMGWRFGQTGEVVKGDFVFTAHVRLANTRGGQAEGSGSLTIMPAWGYQSEDLTLKRRAEVMWEFVLAALPLYKECTLPKHPFAHLEAVEQRLPEVAEGLRKRLELRESIPVLAQRCATAPIRLAFVDAWAKAEGLCFNNMLGREYTPFSLERLFGEKYRGIYLSDVLPKEPRMELRRIHSVGWADLLASADITARVSDGLPQSLEQFVKAHKLRLLKLKLAGRSPQENASRVLEIFQVAEAALRDIGQADKLEGLFLDFNETHTPSQVQEVLELIARDSVACRKLVKIAEQPTKRGDFRQSLSGIPTEVTRVLDEGFQHFNDYQLACDQGYDGFAVKACKGIFDSLYKAAVAMVDGKEVYVMDLTLPTGRPLLQSLVLASVLGLPYLEANGPQFHKPNTLWEEALPGVLGSGGVFHLDGLFNSPGLGIPEI